MHLFGALVKYRLFLFSFIGCVIGIAVLLFLWVTPMHTGNAEALTREYYLCLAQLDEEKIASCLDTLAQNAYDTFEINEITSVLDGLPYQAKNKWCHEMMHYLGWKSYIEQGEIANAFLESSELCDSGMYHGVIEEYLRQHGLNDIEALIKDVCVTSLSAHPLLSEGTQSLCYHGLGHGLMYVTTSDLPASLNYCDTLGKHAEGCYSGAFMEYKTSKQRGPLQNNRDLADFSHCTTLTAAQTRFCFFTQGQSYVSLANGSVAKAVEYCAQVPPAYTQECYRGVGSNTPNPGRSHYKSGIACTEALTVSKEAYEGCIEGGVTFVVQLERGSVEGSMDFCQAATDAYKDYCFTELGSKASVWLTPPSTIEQSCSVLETSAYREACIEGGTY